MMAFWPLSQIIPTNHRKTSVTGTLNIGIRFSRKFKKMDIDWVCKHHTDLSKDQLYAILKLRAEVFVVEQNCPYPDVDGLDLEGDTCHVMAWQDNQLVAYLRLLDPHSQNSDVVIGRVVIAPQARGQGLGHKLMEEGLRQAEKHWPDTSISLSAQAHLQGYYSRYGFGAVGVEYLEDGIAHIGMHRP